jgi:AcrR family transcriptional regulator
VEAGTRTAILLAAERLFAERGFGVSLREIGAAAGQRNHSAVQYHFGTREQLALALFEYRMEAPNRRRLELIAELSAAGREADVAALADALARPLAEHVLRSRGRSAYARFAARLMLSGFQPSPLGEPYTEGVAIVGELLARAMPGLTPERVHIANLHLTTVLASVERRMEDSSFTDEQAVAAVAELMTTLAAILAAPAAPRS